VRCWWARGLSASRGEGRIKKRKQIDVPDRSLGCILDDFNNREATPPRPIRFMCQFIVEATRNVLCVNSIALPGVGGGVNARGRNWTGCVDAGFSVENMLDMAGITLFLVSKIKFWGDFLGIRSHLPNVWHSNFNRDDRIGQNEQVRGEVGGKARIESFAS
jgi:hypothetical protein